MCNTPPLAASSSSPRSWFVHLGLFFATAAFLLAAPAIEESHSALQSVTAAGTSAWSGSFPFALRGVLLCDPEEMLDARPNFVSWDSGRNAGEMGGEWQITFQGVAPGDRGGTTCWMGQNYANRMPPHDDQFSYSNPEWVAEVNRLNFDPATGRKFRAGDLIEVTARQALFYGGKRNINEGHDVEPASNFEIALITPDYGLPIAEVITLADVVEVGGDVGVPASWPAIFDPTRAAGGEHYQGVRVRLNNLRLISMNHWNPGNLWNERKSTVTDGAGRYFTLRHPRSNIGPAPAGFFDALGVFSQESGSGAHGTNGYELFVQQVILRDPPTLSIARTVALSWPADGGAYQLETRTDLGSAAWMTVTNLPVLFEGQYRVLLPQTAEPVEEFYRLRKIH